MSGNGLPPNLAELARPNVPIVGEPDVYEALFMVNMRCRCQPGNHPFTLRGVDMMMTCKGCNTVYMISRVSFNRASGEPPTVHIQSATAPQGTQ